MNELKSKIESLLFVSAKPIAISHLAELIKVEVGELEKAGDELLAEYRESGRGMQIVKDHAKYQMVTAPDNAGLIRELIKDETTGELSRPSLETLTIIAYRGPISRADLNRIRGINCSLILKNLLLRGLIESKEGSEDGESYYSVTFDFIRHLGINDITELPDYERLSKDMNLDEILGEKKEEN
ncbi:SMC-Scp complex subunit ScpB [Candidatus Parcubacteria bacterium]|nr:SMC-Scp complex subunit ScpB [Patescibacteria group bacterium]MBU4309353.1 SMC-Scp complex subunit ScpB [Patescibacteria group bacterium]MBU4431849.1 SMC-Scp complex subunit ScpB [Patescibacteria group bacterium]MBU4577714.1 SMC-Scp complex subunit ScpB [Patescibacteria group bacterium]MCG2697400.1 SMC-Scp complex subunit ScpB [Candidatus Parcubacteria bacterium]